MTTAFLNPDGNLAVVVLNLSDSAQPFSLWLDGQAAKTSSPAHSIMTLLIPRAALSTSARRSGLYR